MDIETILAKQQQYMWGQMNYYRRPISMTRGQGMYMWDIEGKQYLDMFGGILSMSCGHCHPKVTEALVKQVQTLVQCSSVYPHEHAVRYAEMLAEITPPGMTKSYFGLSGTEAVENAVKLACQYTGRSEIIAVRGAYHGLSGLAVNLTSYPGWRPGQILMPGIRHAVQPNCYRCAFKLKYPSCGVACALDIEEIIQRTTSGQIAAFIGEPVAGVSGLITPPVEYFKIVRDIVHKYGGLFIADEVQTMFGRTGKYWYGSAHWDVVPDIMAIGKSIASGTPLSGVVTTPEIASGMKVQIISTFQQNPVSMAAAIAVLEVLKEEAPPSHVEAIGNEIRSGFEKLAEKYPVVGNIRGKGCMQGIEFVKDRETKEPFVELMIEVFEETKDRGLLIGAGGVKSAFRFTPPLVCQPEHVAEAMSELDGAIAAGLKTLGWAN
jgi:alanine-glyoxylate transaminase / (R)-3-amino-2-methylpropionate-pyruvate transaminase